MDINFGKTDFARWMSALHPASDINQAAVKQPFLAISGPDDTGAVGIIYYEKRADGRSPVIDFTVISSTHSTYVLHLFCIA